MSPIESVTRSSLRDFITVWEVPRFARNDNGKMNEARGCASKFPRHT
jgi:hypothetical protein